MQSHFHGALCRWDTWGSPLIYLFIIYLLLESTDLCGHPLMPPNWFLQLWIGQGGRGGISQGLRFWRQLREIPERYCGGQWRRPVQKGPVLAEWYESRSRMIAKQDWA